MDKKKKFKLVVLIKDWKESWDYKQISKIRKSMGPNGDNWELPWDESDDNLMAITNFGNLRVFEHELLKKGDMWICDRDWEFNSFSDLIDQVEKYVKEVEGE